MKRRILALVCIAEGMTQKEAGKHVGMAENSVGKWVNKYREGGINAVRDGELGRPRRKRSRSASESLCVAALTGTLGLNDWDGADQASAITALVIPLELLLLVLRLHGGIVVAAMDRIGLADASIKAFSRSQLIRKVVDRRAQIGLEVGIEDALARVIQFFRQRVQIRVLACRCPIDAEARALGQHRMNDHDGSPVAVEERVAVGEIAHDLAGLVAHGLGIAPELQRMLDGVLDVFGMGEEHAAPAHRDIGRRGGAILPRPWINGVKQNLMRVENVGVGERHFLGEPRESIVDTGRKGRMLKPPDDRGVLFLSEFRR
jgi:hypothetical protein